MNFFPTGNGPISGPPTANFNPDFMQTQLHTLIGS